MNCVEYTIALTWREVIALWNVVELTSVTTVPFKTYISFSNSNVFSKNRLLRMTFAHHFEKRERRILLKMLFFHPAYSLSSNYAHNGKHKFANFG